MWQAHDEASLALEAAAFARSRQTLRAEGVSHAVSLEEISMKELSYGNSTVRSCGLCVEEAPHHVSTLQLFESNCGILAHSPSYWLPHCCIAHMIEDPVSFSCDCIITSCSSCPSNSYCSTTSCSREAPS